MALQRSPAKIQSRLDILCLTSDSFWFVGPITLKEREAKVRRYKEKRDRRVRTQGEVSSKGKRLRVKNKLYVD